VGLHVDVLCCRRKNPEKPHNRYLVAVYKCQEGFSLQDPSVDRLYCSEDKWVGEEPVCTATSNDNLLLSPTFWCYFLYLTCSSDVPSVIHFNKMTNFDICVTTLCTCLCVALGIS
jgi:hypothetical protein